MAYRSDHTSFIDCLSVAKSIGDALCDDAVWDQDRNYCNWMGATFIVAGPRKFSALDGSLYSGSTGIAHALYHLYIATGQQRYFDHAIGAVRRSIKYYFGRNSSGDLYSYHNGALASLLLAVKILRSFREDIYGEALDEIDAFVEWSQEILLSIESPLSVLMKRGQLDYVTGIAGMIEPLTELSNLLGKEVFLHVANQFVSVILESAEWSSSECSWKVPITGNGVHKFGRIGGLAHGAAGFAIPLLSIYAATGNRMLLETAQGALRFQNTLFSRKHENWVDARFAYTRLGDEIDGVFSTAWCHGAPGISLAFALAYQIDIENRAEYRQWAEIGLRTTVTELERLSEQDCDPTLCHGLAGLNECLMVASRALGDASHEKSSSRYASFLVGKISHSRSARSGVPNGDPNPSFFIGQAGVLYHLLQQIPHLNIPSLLAPNFKSPKTEV